MNHRSFIVAVACIAMLSLAACATRPPLTNADGFLTRYDAVQPTPDGAERALPLTEADRRDLSCIVVEEPAIAAMAGLTDDQTARLKRTLRSRLAETVRGVAPPEGGRCARIRSRVLAVAKSDVLTNIVFGVVLLPFLPSNGGVAIEAELVGPDGRQEAALIWSRTGSPFSVFDGLRATGQAEALTRAFSQRFAELLGLSAKPNSN